MKLLLLIVLIWQGAQAYTKGYIGIPGVWTMPVSVPKDLGEIIGKDDGLPSDAAMRGWVKSRAREFAGGVDAQGRILYGFEVWLEPPADMKSKIASVSYAFDAPSATPKTQSSKDAKQRFQVKFGGASCAKMISVSITFEDGRKRDFKVDGCSILV